MGRLPDGRAVFVPFALPGETVRLRLTEEKRGHARAELLEIITPSPSRIQPPCPHFTVCGGCHYQHLPYPAQLEAKTAIFKEQLERMGHLQDPPVQPIVSSPAAYFYRNHVQYHLTPEGKLGYYKANSNQVIAIQECHLPELALNQLVPQLDIEAIPGLERVGLRLGADEDIQLILESRDPAPPEALIEELPISAVYLSPAGSLVMAGSEQLLMEVLDRRFQVSAGSFFQVNTAMAARMVDHLLAYLPLSPTTTILDVYCGVGLFSAFLAPRVGRLIAIEASSAACSDFEVNLDEFDNVELYEAPAEAVLPHLDSKPDIILVDPPRSGLEPAALDGILALHPPLLAYVSCDPATLARDARRLSQGGYRLKHATPFDLFPQTYHIESISLWEKGEI